ncbi:MAG TPA: glycosyltransferase [Thermodesulfobacteriota bacterium]|nr:glycosyltransferase [Thermodesulfobacteriota bacterium]
MKVSVLIITYNHAKFIAQALDSVLMQKVNFDYEILISEDCSTDSTRDIIIGFQKRYPDRIRLLLSEQNLNSNEVIVRGIQASQGQYIALLDGDDYWTSPYKLQKQVDFLDNNPECAMCFHDVTEFYEDGSREPQNFIFVNQKEIVTLADLLAGNFCYTCSAIFRRGLFGDFPDWYYLLEMGDYPLHVLNAQHGKIGYIHEIMGTYRIHSGGYWSTKPKIQQLRESIEAYKYISAHLNYKYDRIIRGTVSKHYYKIAVEYEDGGDLVKARSYAIKCFVECPFNKRIPHKDLFKLLIRLHAPLLYKLIRTLGRSVRLITYS